MQSIFIFLFENIKDTNIIFLLLIVWGMYLFYKKVFIPLGLLQRDFDHLRKDVEKIYCRLDRLESHLFETKSPKQITDSGYDVLEKNNVDSFLSTSDLLNRDFSNKKDSDIYVECFKWIEENGKEKVWEMIYNGDFLERECKILLSLALLEKVKNLKKVKESKKI